MVDSQDAGTRNDAACMIDKIEKRAYSENYNLSTGWLTATMNHHVDISSEAFKSYFINESIRFSDYE
jgi:hypothetical protein